MVKRDVIKDEIEQLGRAIGKIFSDFIGLKSQGKISQGIDISNQQFKEELDLDIEVLLASESEDFIRYFEDKKCTPEHLEMIFDYFIEMGDYKISINKNEADSIFNKALNLCEIIDNKTKIYSFSRITKMERIKKLLEI